MNNVCYHCFSQLLDGTTVCPNCGQPRNDEQEGYPLALPCGSVLNGTYILGHVLGQGGFGITYAAQDYRSKKLVAVKEFYPENMAARSKNHTVVPSSVNMQENFRYGKACFLKEAQTLAEFRDNPYIVRIYRYFEENGTAYFVMDYIHGESLESYMIQHGKPFRNRKATHEGGEQNKSLDWSEASRLLFPIMDALSAVHEKGIIHRDVAPDNIFITTGAAMEPEVKLLDFGAARYSLGNRSHSLDVILKHGFAPKEQYSRRGRQGPFTDVYSMAATFYYVLTGRKPMDSIDRNVVDDDLILPSSLGADIPDYVENALDKALSVEARDRYQTMEEFRQALTADQPVPSPVPKPELVPDEPDSKPDAGNDSKSKQPKWLPLGAGAAALLVIVAAVAGGGGKMESDSTSVPPALSSPVQPEPELAGNGATSDPGMIEADPVDSFVPEDIIDQPQLGEEGISSGNLLNGGHFTFHGNDCYYIETLKLYQGSVTGDHMFFPAKYGDAPDKEFDLYASRDINIAGDCLYYIGGKYSSLNDFSIMRASLDGSIVTDVLDCNPDHLYINGGWLFYSNYKGLFRIALKELEEVEDPQEIDSDQITCIADDLSSSKDGLCFMNGRIYYNGRDGITVIDPDGSNKEVISKASGNLLTDGSVLFCLSGLDEIKRIRANGGEDSLLETEIMIDTETGDWYNTIRYINYADGWVYFTLEEKDGTNLWRISVQGQVTEKVGWLCGKDDTLLSVCTHPSSDYVYYFFYAHQDNGLLACNQRLLVN